MAEFGVWHLSDNPKAYQPVRQNNYRFIVNGLDKLLRVGGDANSADDYIYNAQEILDFSVVKFDAPHFSQQTIEVKRGNSTLKYAGVPSFKSGQLVINDFSGADGKSILEAWQNLSYNVIDDTIQSSDKYKVNATILEYLPDNTLISYWELQGCWVSGISEDSYDSESGNKKTVTATIEYDRAIPHRPD